MRIAELEGELASIRQYAMNYWPLTTGVTPYWRRTFVPDRNNYHGSVGFKMMVGNRSLKLRGMGRAIPSAQAHLNTSTTVRIDRIRSQVDRIRSHPAELAQDLR